MQLPIVVAPLQAVNEVTDTVRRLADINSASMRASTVLPENDEARNAQRAQLVIIAPDDSYSDARTNGATDTETDTTDTTETRTDVTDTRTDATDSRTDATDTRTDATDMLTDATDMLTDVTDMQTDATDTRTDVTDTTDMLTDTADTWTAATGPRTDTTDMRTDATDMRTDKTDTRTDVTDQRTNATDTRTDVTDMRTDTTDTRTDTTDTRTDATDTRTDATDTRTDVTDTRTDTTDTLTDATDTRTDATDPRTDATDTRTDVTDTRTDTTDTLTDATDPRTDATDTRADATDKHINTADTTDARIDGTTTPDRRTNTADRRTNTADRRTKTADRRTNTADRRTNTADTCTNKPVRPEHAVQCTASIDSTNSAERHDTDTVLDVGTTAPALLSTEDPRPLPTSPSSSLGTSSSDDDSQQLHIVSIDESERRTVESYSIQILEDGSFELVVEDVDDIHVADGCNTAGSQVFEDIRQQEDIALSDDVAVVNDKPISPVQPDINVESATGVISNEVSNITNGSTFSTKSVSLDNTVNLPSDCASLTTTNVCVQGVVHEDISDVDDANRGDTSPSESSTMVALWRDGVSLGTTDVSDIGAQEVVYDDISDVDDVDRVLQGDTSPSESSTMAAFPGDGVSLYTTDVSDIGAHKVVYEDISDVEDTNMVSEGGTNLGDLSTTRSGNNHGLDTAVTTSDSFVLTNDKECTESPHVSSPHNTSLDASSVAQRDTCSVVAAPSRNTSLESNKITRAHILGWSGAKLLAASVAAKFNKRIAEASAQKDKSSDTLGVSTCSAHSRPQTKVLSQGDSNAAIERELLDKSNVDLSSEVPCSVPANETSLQYSSANKTQLSNATDLEVGSASVLTCESTRNGTKEPGNRVEDKHKLSVHEYMTRCKQKSTVVTQPSVPPPSSQPNFVDKVSVDCLRNILSTVHTASDIVSRRVPADDTHNYVQHPPTHQPAIVANISRAAVSRDTEMKQRARHLCHRHEHGERDRTRHSHSDHTGSSDYPYRKHRERHRDSRYRGNSCHRDRSPHSYSSAKHPAKDSRRNSSHSVDPRLYKSGNSQKGGISRYACPPKRTPVVDVTHSYADNQATTDQLRAAHSEVVTVQSNQHSTLVAVGGLTPGPTPGPVGGPTPGPVGGPTPGLTPGPVGGPTPGPVGGPTPGLTPGPVGGPTPGPVGGPTPGLTPGPVGGPTPGPVGGPTLRPMEGSTPRLVGGPTAGPVGKTSPGPMGGLALGPTLGPVEELTPGPMERPTPGPVGGPTPGTMEQPTPGPVGGLTPGPVGGLTPGPMGGPTPGPVGGPTAGPVGGLAAGPTPGPVGGPSQGPMGGPTPGLTSEPVGGFTPEPTPGPVEGLTKVVAERLAPSPHHAEREEAIPYSPSAPISQICRHSHQSNIAELNVESQHCNAYTVEFHRWLADFCTTMSRLTYNLKRFRMECAATDDPRLTEYWNLPARSIREDTVIIPLESNLTPRNSVSSPDTTHAVRTKSVQHGRRQSENIVTPLAEIKTIDVAPTLADGADQKTSESLTRESLTVGGAKATETKQQNVVKKTEVKASSVPVCPTVSTATKVVRRPARHVDGKPSVLSRVRWGDVGAARKPVLLLIEKCRVLPISSETHKRHKEALLATQERLKTTSIFVNLTEDLDAETRQRALDGLICPLSPVTVRRLWLEAQVAAVPANLPDDCSGYHVTIASELVQRELLNTYCWTDTQLVEVLPPQLRLQPELNRFISLEGCLLFARRMPFSHCRYLYALKTQIETVWSALRKTPTDALWDQLGWLHLLRRRQIAKVCLTSIKPLRVYLPGKLDWYR